MAPAAERMKKYRERLKKDAVKYEDHLKKERERDKKRSKIKKEAKDNDPNLREKLRQQVRDRVRAYRNRKKAKSASIVNISPIGTYKCQQTFGKAIKKIKQALPHSPHKKEAVVRKLVVDILNSNIVTVTTPKTKTGRPPLTEQERNTVKEFYGRDDISRQAPGIKDVISIKNKNTGKSEKIQKRHMVISIDEAYEHFKEVHAEISLSRAAFFKLRPRHILPVAYTPHNVCVCSIHANIINLIEAISRKVPEFLNNQKKLLEKLSCNISDEKCMTNICTKCPNNLRELYEDIPTVSVTWKKWTDLSSYPKLISVSGQLQEALNELNNLAPKFKIHSYVKKVQSEYFQEKRNSISSDEVVVQIDFAENYAMVSQDEIQSAHWHHSQVTVFTCCLWFPKNDTESLVIVSDDLSHNKYAVWTFMKKIVYRIHKSHPDVQKLFIFSDNCAAQFKCKYTVSTLCLLKQHFPCAEWNFFAASHGKGAVDGIGGVIKRTVWTAVKSRRAIVNSPLDFYNTVLNSSTGIAVDFISKEDIEKEMPFLNGIWEKVIAIPAIRTLHHFSAVDESNILISRTAASEKTKFEVFLPTKPSKTTMNSDSQESENEWQTPLSILKKAKETESTVHESVASTSRLRYSDVYSDSDEESLENVFNPSVAVTDIRPNVYVLCTVQCEGRSASTMYRYVGVCQGLVNEDGEVKIMFLKNFGDTGTIFKPDESDVSYVAFDDIICILPTPTLKLKGNRPYYEFSAEVDVFEKG